MSDSSSPSAHRFKKRPRRLTSSSESDSEEYLPHLKRNVLRLMDTSSSSSSSEDDLVFAWRKVKGRHKIAVPDTSEEEDDDSDFDLLTHRKMRVGRVVSESSGTSSERNSRSSLSANEGGSSEWETDTETQPRTTPVGVVDSSSDEEAEKCPICLLSFKNQQVGTPESCEHTFCLQCISEWAKTMNTCPVDRKAFSKIHIRERLNGKYQKLMVVPPPAPPTEMEYEVPEENPTFCEICDSPEMEDTMLLCDGCDLGYHISCLDPPLASIPEGLWYCPSCNLVGAGARSLGNVQFELEMDIHGLMSRRSVPRTRQNERVRDNLILRLRFHRFGEQANTSSVADMSQPGPSERSRPATVRRRKKKVQKRKVKRKSRARYRTVYVVDENTGETIAEKRKIKARRRRKKKTKKPKGASKEKTSVKTRLAEQLGICRKQRVDQHLPDIRERSNGDLLTRPTFHLFAPRDELEYFPESEEEYGLPNDLLVRRRPNSSDLTVLRRRNLNKTIAIPSTALATNHNPLTDILQSQSDFFSRDSVLRLNSDGTVNIEHTRQAPMYPESDNNVNTSYHGEREVNTNGSNAENSLQNVPSSTTITADFGFSGSSGADNEQPRDYSNCGLFRMYDQEEEKKEDDDGKKVPCKSGGETPNSVESDVDIYSDIETVTTSKVEESEERGGYVEAGHQHQMQGTDDDNDNSDTELVIDTDKTDKMESPITTEPDLSSKDETVSSTVDADYPPRNQSCIRSISSTNQELQSGTVQSSNFPVSTTLPMEEDDDEKEEEDDLNDDCPNFSIYSSESIDLAKTTERELLTAIKLCDEVTSTPKALEKPKETTLYSDSDDEKVKVELPKSFGIGDIRNITEDVSEDERSYTPCLDERSGNRDGIEGLDTEMISDEDRNDFDETQDVKTNSDGGDALEINAKESELDFSRPEDFEEGEIVDKKKKLIAAEESKAEEANREVEKEEKAGKSEDSKKSSDVQSKDLAFKKLSKNSKDRNYRDKDKDRSKSRDRRGKSDKDSKKDKRKEKRKEIARYDVRTVISKPRKTTDEFGRDIKRSTASRSLTPPRRNSFKSRRSTSKDKSKKLKDRSHSRSRSLDRSPRKRRRRSQSSDARKRRKRSSSRSKRRGRSHHRSRSKSRDSRRHDWSEREFSQERDRERVWSQARSRSPEQVRQTSPSWTPPRVVDKPANTHNLTVILTNDKKKKDKRKKTDKKKEKDDKSEKRAKKKKSGMERSSDRNRLPSKEVFASGDNILVSVSFNKDNESRDVIASSVSGIKRKHEVGLKEKKQKRRDREREREKDKEKEREKVKSKKKDLTGIKPVAIIDLDRSPFKEITPSPKNVIILSDSENGENNDLLGLQKALCDSSSQQVGSPESTTNFATGPKTPPEPQVKFSLNVKPSTLRPISNPLHDPDDVEPEIDVQEELEQRLNEVIYKGPNTPPEPPNSPPSSPDAYDPFDPTKSRSPTPEPQQPNAQSTGAVVDERKEVGGAGDEKVAASPVAAAKTPEAAVAVTVGSKSHTPPLLEAQPDSQNSVVILNSPAEKNSPPTEKSVNSVINQSIPPTLSLFPPLGQPVPYSTVVQSVVASTPVSTTNLTIPKINILNSSILTPLPHVPTTPSQRILLPNVTCSPIKATSPVKLKSPAKTGRSGGRKSGDTLDLDSPYSPGSSDYEDLFEPPPDAGAKANNKNQAAKNKVGAVGGVTQQQQPTVGQTAPAAKVQNAFDALFGSSPVYGKNGKSKNEKGKQTAGARKATYSPQKGTKQVGVKLDEDNLKILDELPNSAVEMQVKDKFLKKLNRQERVVEEVKLVLKPHYNKKRINKEEYKDILRRAVPKICHNRSGEINPHKIKNLIEAYVKKVRHSKKVTSSSSVNVQKT